MRSFREEKTVAAVQFILTTLILCVAAFFYIKFYYPFRASTGPVIERLKENLTPAIFFGAFSVIWFIFWISTNVKYGRVSRYYGSYFGGVFGRLLLLLELAGYVLVIVFLFI